MNMQFRYHWIVTYCTKSGCVQAKHYRSAVGFNDGWARIMRPGPVWAVAHLLSRTDGALESKIVKDYGVMT